MTWRRDVEALVGAPASWPAIVVTPDDGEIRWRLLSPAASPAHVVDARRRSARVGEIGRASMRELPMRDASVAWAVVSFVRDASPRAARGALVAELARVLAPGGTLVVVDHNRPRGRAAALLATVLPPRPRGKTPAAAWRRLAYPAAREARGAGIVVDRLRLAARERVQVMWGRRAAK